MREWRIKKEENGTGVSVNESEIVN